MDVKVITFFDFKVGRNGILRIGAIEVLPQTLERCSEYAAIVHPSDRPQYSHTFSRSSTAIYRMLNERIWIGHDIIRSDYPRLKKAFAKINKDPPRPIFIIDTSHFLLTNTKIAKLAVHFGLGSQGKEGSHEDCVQNINAIKLCEAALSLYEPDVINNYVGQKFHPMISLLMKISADADAVVTTTRFSQLEIDEREKQVATNAAY